VKSEKLESEMMAEITLEFPEGFGKGEITSSTSAFVRPFRVLIEEGRDVGRINYLFCHEDRAPVHTFGALCYAPSKRLLFFPGLVVRKLLWHSKLKGFIPPQGFIDHFTIEPNFETWHITTLIDGKKEERKNWLPSFKLFELQPNIYFWFGLSIQDIEELELTPKTVRWPFLHGSQEGLKKKTDIVMKAREGAKFQILQLPENKKEGTFLHFDILIDNRKFKYFKKFDLKSVAPFNKPSLIKEIEPNLQFIARVHKVRLKNFNGEIIIGVSQHQGIISEKAIITNPEV
jgi:hypothetical protein